MKISDFLWPETIKPNLEAKGKREAFEELLDILIESGKVESGHKNEIIDILMERESLGSTGIGQGVGIPHGKSGHVDRLIAALGFSKQGVDFDALDGEKVNIVFLMLAPKGVTGPHLKALAHISRILRDRLIRERLLKSNEVNEIFNILAREDEKHTVS